MANCPKSAVDNAHKKDRLTNLFEAVKEKENAANLAGFNGAKAICETVQFHYEVSTKSACQATGICGNCRHAMPAMAMDEWGAALRSRVPAFVRTCRVESGPLWIQLVQVWDNCRFWDGRT